MFGIGLPELIVILVVALIVFGPKKLPELARALGKGMAEFKKATQEIKDNLNLNEDLQAVRKDLTDSFTGIDQPPGTGEAEKLPEEQGAKFESYDPSYPPSSPVATEESAKKDGEKKEDPGSILAGSITGIDQPPGITEAGKFPEEQGAKFESHDSTYPLTPPVTAEGGAKKDKEKEEDPRLRVRVGDHVH